MIRLLRRSVFGRHSLSVYLLMTAIVLIIQLLLAISFYSYGADIETRHAFPIQTNIIGHNFNNLTEYYAEKSMRNNKLNTNDIKNEINISEKLKSLGIKPVCNISSKYAVSAIQRAHSLKCRQQLANIACLSQTDLYPNSLPRYCPLKDGNFGDSVGCFHDTAKPRLLTGYKNKFLDNSRQKCLNICLQSGFSYAGLQFGSECFCGVEVPPNSRNIDRTHCNMTCSGDANQLCGGYFSIDIYKTGLPKLPKIIASPVLIDGQSSIRIAFILTINGRALRQVKRLINNIYDKKHFYYIHVDSRQDFLYRNLLYLEDKYLNIRLSRVRLSTIWGGASLLQMLLHCISQILHLPEWSHSFDYVINISESDFPIKPLSQLEVFLSTYNGSNYLKSHGQDGQRFIAKQGLDKTFYECDTHMWRIDDRSLPTGIRWDGGSDWVILTRQFCDYVINENNDLINGLNRIFKYTLLPAESYFHTILQNSEFCSTMIDNNLRLTNWRRKQGCKCQYKHIVDWCGCSPNDFKLNDWFKLSATESKPFYFARKFEPVVNLAIINRLEEWIRNTNYANTRSYDKYWQNEFSIKDWPLVFDNEKLTFYHIIAMIFLKTLECDKNLKADHKDLVVMKHINEANLYFESDLFRGILVSFDATHTSFVNSKLSFEILVQPINKVIFHQNNKLIDKLLTLQVCSDFDPKEQIFRNFGCILGPFSQPVALHKWIPSSEIYTTTFVWLDPIEVVAASYDVKIESKNITHDSASVLIQKPKLTLPLRPGVWKLMILYNWIMIAETQFIISPLLYFNRTKVGKEMVKSLHSGPSQHYTDHNFSSIETLLGYHQKNSSNNLQQSLKNSRKYGRNLIEWIQSLYYEFWYIQRICYVSHTTSLNLDDLHCNIEMPSCRTTEWSSLSPDPKSEINY